ncbi:TPA: hypothetical protein N0F65_011872 [Lagenidium giganteum]|uniref:Uncharacterized protein n=1 Tax=Lagenidium giganteum TaxID=4803 RepID=A0AAV2YGW4_9STRA|nr:TPA: hypothetical protein N0F65_011872 [Lagenidium giganteum]
MSFQKNLEQLRDTVVSAFMNAPQIDARNARVPVDIAVQSDSARAKVCQSRDATYWAYSSQLPVTSC